MVSESILITNANGKKYQFFAGEVNSARYGIITKLFKAPMPEDGGDNQIIINLGKDKIASAEFKLLQDVGDASVGSPGGITTIQQKMDYILDTFLTDGVNDLYTIDINTTVGNILGKQGIVENFSFNFSGQTPSSLPGSLSFSLGGGNQNQ